MRDPGVVRARAPAREQRGEPGAFWSTPMSALSSTLTVRHSPRGNGMSPRSKELASGGWKPRLCRGASRPPRTYLVLQTPQRLAVRSNEGACFCYAKPQYVPGRMPLPALGGVCPAVLSPKNLEQNPLSPYKNRRKVVKLVLFNLKVSIVNK